jgi:NAD(P)-dependent dehydrogenase (short-subunit alcohol dehydrogenase family)/glyoxylase-like metal-dependent hydrolase (beta-lactamase superfamily II)
MATMQIAPGIYLLAGTVGGRPLQLSLLVGSERRVLLDTGCAGDPQGFISARLAELGLTPTDIDLVINTHADSDHCGGNADWRRLSPRTLLTCGDLDRALIEDPQVMWAQRYSAYAALHGIQYDEAVRTATLAMLGHAQPVDFTWRGGETLRLGPDWSVEIRAVPGHSAGHLAVFDPRSRTALVADAVHGAGLKSMAGEWAMGPTYIHPDDYLRTLAAIRNWGAEQLLGCHWPLCRTPAEISAFLNESEQFVRLADRALLGELAAHPEGRTLREVLTAIGPQLGAWPRAVDMELVYPFAGHVERLAAQGRLIVDRSARPVRLSLPVAAPVSRPTRRLEGRVAIVTGAGRGIGAAIATRMAEAGARVIVAELDPASGEATAARLRQAGHQAHAIPTDVGDPDSVERMVAATVAHFGPPEVLVNNAGVNVFHDPLHMPQSEWERCFRVDLTGVWYGCRAVLPHMLARGRGSIVNIASVHGFQIIPHCFPYPVAKHGLLGLTRALAIEYARRHIRVNAICPGYIETELSVIYWDTFPDPAAERQRAYALHPPGRIGTPDEVAWPAVFLASDEAGFINGESLVIDGGRSVLYHGEGAGT